MSQSDSQSLTVGFAGIGKMGKEMVFRLLNAKYRVLVYNRSSAALEPVLAAGAVAASSPQELCAADVLVSMLNDDAAVQSVLIDSGVIENFGTGKIHVCCTTLPVAYVKNTLAPFHDKHGVKYLSCPVMGRPEAVAAGKLHLIIGGDTGAIETVRPVLDALGPTVWVVGDTPEKANIMKIAMNYSILGLIETMGESIALVRNHGVEGSALVDLMLGTMFDCPVYANYGRMIAQEKYSPAGATLEGVGLKDISLALAAGADSRTPLPVASVIRDAVLDGLAHGDGQLDWCSVAKVAARRAGLEK